MTPNPWPSERVVVVSDDPPSVEGAVTQLEAWGALPAVMFERSRAMAALEVREPDLVVLDFGRGEEAAGDVLVTLEELQPVLPGAAHVAPVVALAEGAVGTRLERDAWAPLHVTPHDDPARVREALLAALDDATGTVGAVTAGRRSVAPALAAAAVVGLAGVGAVVFVVLRQADLPAGEQPAAQVPTTQPAPTMSPPTLAPTTQPAPTLAPTTQPAPTQPAPTTQPQAAQVARSL